MIDVGAQSSQSPGSNTSRQVGLGYVRKLPGKWGGGVRGRKEKGESDIIPSFLSWVVKPVREPISSVPLRSFLSFCTDFPK